METQAPQHMSQSRSKHCLRADALSPFKQRSSSCGVPSCGDPDAGTLTPLPGFGHRRGLHVLTSI
eukprot:1150973-Pelagomonas_calceolata.AAC.3